VHDLTNDDTDYTRNYVRHELLPRMERVNKGAGRNISRAAALLSEDEEALADSARRSGCVEQGEYGAAVDIEKLKTLMLAVQKRVLRLTVQEHCGLTDIENVHVDALLRLALKGKSGKRADIGRGYFAAVVYGKLIIGRAGEKQYNEAFEALSGCFEFGGWRFEAEHFTGEPQYGAGAEYFNASAVAGAVFRCRREGDVITPLGMEGTKRLSDYLSDRKVPLHRRDILTVLARGKEVFWVVGVGVSDKSRVKPGTDIIKISFGETGYARGHQKDTVQ
jgi:tRNA(Ile)-lysidine synthase